MQEEIIKFSDLPVGEIEFQDFAVADYALRASYKSVFESAWDALSELSDGEKKQLCRVLNVIFCMWRNEKGSYPPVRKLEKLDENKKIGAVVDWLKFHTICAGF